MAPSPGRTTGRRTGLPRLPEMAFGRKAVAQRAVLVSASPAEPGHGKLRAIQQIAGVHRRALALPAELPKVRAGAPIAPIGPPGRARAAPQTTAARAVPGMLAAKSIRTAITPIRRHSELRLRTIAAIRSRPVNIQRRIAPTRPRIAPTRRLAVATQVPAVVTARQAAATRPRAVVTRLLADLPQLPATAREAEARMAEVALPTVVEVAEAAHTDKSIGILHSLGARLV